jgi:hypothetical protein
LQRESDEMLHDIWAGTRELEGCLGVILEKAMTTVITGNPALLGIPRPAPDLCAQRRAGR